MVQPAAQRSLCFPGNAAERQLHPAAGIIAATSISVTRCWGRPRSASQPWILTRRRSTSSSGAVQSKRAWVSTPLWKSGYLGSHGVHLQRAHLINNAPPGPGADRAAPSASRDQLSCRDTVLPDNVFTLRQRRLPNGTICFPVSTINLLENTAQSWYDAGYVNVRRRYAHGLTFLGNYTCRKTSATRLISVLPCLSPRSRRTTTTWQRRRDRAATSATVLR